MRGTKTNTPGIYLVSPGLYVVCISYKDALTREWKEKSRRVRGTMRDARDAQAELRTKWVRGEFSTTKGTVEEAIREWLRLSRSSIGDNTAYNYERTLEKWVYPRLGQMPLRDLSTKDLDDLYTDLLGVLAKATVRKLAGNIKAALAQAVTWKWISVNPALACKRIRLNKGRPRVPEFVQVSHYLDWVHEQDPLYGRMFWLNFYLGDRLGETLGLRYSRIDWENCRVLLDTSISYVPGKGKIPKGIKQEEPHWVGLNMAGMHLLREQVDYMRQRAESGDVSPRNMKDFYLWSDDIDGHSPWIPQRVSVAFRRYREKYPKEVDVTVRKLRHLNATVLLSNGMPLKDVSGRLGHSSIKTTSDFYVDNASSNDALAATILDNLRTETSSSEHE